METPAFDHLMYAGSNLDAVVEHVTALTGVRAASGGVHEGFGTHNALLGLGEGRYLELIGPVPGQEDASPFAAMLAGLAEPRTFMWAVRTDDLEAFTRAAQADGYNPGGIADMSRARQDGSMLTWQVTMGGADVIGGVLPFGIRWLTGGHPADSVPGGCTLFEFRAEHPEPERMRTALAALHVHLSVDRGEVPALVAILDTPKGRIALR